ncbi:matrixin family metalloprotease [Myxococcota bacterium]|nr:matrixin family metalloprotease [Myxococcota bacterium]
MRALHATRRALALAILTLPSAAHAFELARSPSGAALVWPRATLDYDVTFDPAELVDLALADASRRALDTWGSALRGRVVPRYLGVAPSPPVRGDGRVTITIRSAWDPANGDPTRAIAFTALTYDTDTGEISDAELELNGEHFAFGDASGAFDTESVVLHEAGHALGFAHSCGDPQRTYASCFSVPDDPPGTARRILEAVMAPTLAPSVERRALGLDDLGALADHYPVSSTVTAPILQRLRRTCPDGALVVEGERLPVAPRLALRTSRGAHVDVEIQRASSTELVLTSALPITDARFDVVVVDPATRAYDVLHTQATPEVCVVEPPDPVVPPADEGCTCVAPRTGSLGALALFVVAALLFVPGRAEAYKCSRAGGDTGPSLFWGKRELPWAVNAAATSDLASVEDAIAQVRAGHQVWEDIDCSDLTLPFAGAIPGLSAGFDQSGANRNAVVFVEAAWPYAAGAIAITTNAYDTRTGEILDSDIEVNGEDFRFTNADAPCDPKSGLMDVRNAITHEVGHVLGLDHPPNTTRYAETTMFASAPSCETKKRTLAPDDVDGICAIYPAGERTEQCYPADGPGFALVESNDGFGGCTCLGDEVQASLQSSADAPRAIDARAGRFGLVLAGALTLLGLGARRARRPSRSPRA